MLWYSGSLPSNVDLATALLAMDAVHLPIGVVEGTVSVAVIRFVMATRAEAVGRHPRARGLEERRMTSYNRKTLLVGVAIALLIGGGVSYFASQAPDGLEKTQQNLGATEPPHGGVAVPPAVFHEYNVKWLGEGFWSNAIAGVTGTLLVLAILLGVGRLLRPRKPPDPAFGHPSRPRGQGVTTLPLSPTEDEGRG